MNLGRLFEIDSKVECASVDRAEDAADIILREAFASTCVDTIEWWESEFGIIPSSAEIAVRRQAVIAKMRSQRNLRKSMFEAVAEGLGYTIGPAGSVDPHLRIVEGDQWKLFRAGLSAAGDKVYFPTTGVYTPYTVRIYGTSVESDAVLQGVFRKLKTHGTTHIFVNE